MAAIMYYLPVFIAVTCIKFLLLPAYKSTDFEVHRNWLAITHNFHYSKWYTEATSKWTLDYPPLFAWFEWFLSQFAVFFDPKMLRISNLDYASKSTILFQRLTVIVSDIVFAYAVVEFCKQVIDPRKKEKDPWKDRGTILAILFLWNPGLLIVDHIHFQYNGLLSGLLLLSMVRISQNRIIEGAIWFTLLLNMKHIYLYVAPAFFVYLFRNYCFTRSKRNGHPDFSSFNFLNLIKLSITVLSIFAISFGPFIYKGQLSQVLSRLFPFKRGLTHAYWAPNYWALYNTFDKGLAFICSRLPFLNVTQTAVASMTGGLVEEYPHAILPSITPLVTIILTFITMIPILWNLWKTPKDPWIFVRALVICAFCSFLFGWHVHEKAILMVILPLTPLAVIRPNEAKNYLFLSTVAHYSLFPLLPNPAETPIKILLLLLHSIYAFSSITRLHSKIPGPKTAFLPMLTTAESLYLFGLIGIQFYYSFGHTILGIHRYQFFPLLLVSTYCAIGIIYSWLKLYVLFLTNRNYITLQAILSPFKIKQK